MLPLKVSRNEQRSVICFRWAKGRKCHSVWDASSVLWQVLLQDHQYMFGVKSLLIVDIVLLTSKNLVAVLFWRPMQRSQRSIPSCGQTGVLWDKCLHEFGRYIEKWNNAATRFFLINNTFSTTGKLFTPNMYCWSCKILVTIYWMHLRLNGICTKSFCPQQMNNRRLFLAGFQRQRCHI